MRVAESMRTERGFEVMRSAGKAVSRRPVRSPAFQKKKASGMKDAGSRIRGESSEVFTLRILCVKTGKNIVMPKVRNTAEESHLVFLKRIQSDADLRGESFLSTMSSVRSLSLWVCCLRAAICKNARSVKNEIPAAVAKYASAEVEDSPAVSSFALTGGADMTETSWTMGGATPAMAWPVMMP